MGKSDLLEDPARSATGWRGRGAGWGLALAAGVILVEVIWRLWLGGEFLFDASIPGRTIALLRWRMLDGFAGWVGLVMLLLADGGRRGDLAEAAASPLRRFTRSLPALLRWVVAAGVAAAAVELIGEGGGGEGGAAAAMEVAAVALLALAAVIVAWRTLGELARGMREAGGMTIEHLSRLLAMQWLLVWVAAEVLLLLRKPGEAEDAARSLLFALAAFGFVPNVMMALGIRWLGAGGFAEVSAESDGAAGGVRVRAWLVGVAAVNVGAVALVLTALGRGGLGWLGAAGGVAMVFGLALYVLGFARTAWRGAGGWLVAAGLATLALGILLAAGERLAAGEVLREYTAAWRFLVLPGSVILWLVGMAQAASAAVVPERLRSRGPALAAAMLIAMGVVLTAAMFLLATADRDWLQGVGVAAALLLLGVLLACAATLRAWRGRRLRG